MARRAAASLRLSAAMLLTLRPETPASRRRISRPVVPASPSMKTAGITGALRFLLVGFVPRAVLAVIGEISANRQQKGRCGGAALASKRSLGERHRSRDWRGRRRMQDFTGPVMRPLWGP